MNPAAPRPVAIPATNVQSVGALYGLAMASVGFLLLSLVTRLPEFISDLIRPVPYMLPLALLCSLLVMAVGGFSRIFPSKIALVFTGLAGWVVAAVPFAIWKGGSFAVLREYWVLSAATFFLVAGLPLTLKDCSRLMRTLGLSAVLLLLASFKFSASLEGRLVLTASSLSNPNLLAIQLLYGLPFIYLVFRRFPKGLGTTITFISVTYGAYLLYRTGSRSALITMAVIALLLLITGSLRRRVAVISFAVLGAVFIVSSGSVALNRYLTLFSSEAENVDTYSAKESGAVRWKLFLESLEITARNPVFGVGPGNFSVATADLKREDQTVSAWLGSHNTATQFSSEAGVPASVAFIILVVAALVMNTRMYLRTRRDKDPFTSQLAFSLLLSCIGMTVSCLFASIAYQFYFPVLFGLTLAMQRVVLQQPQVPAVAPVAAPTGFMQNRFSVPAATPIVPARAPEPAYPKLRRPPRDWARGLKRS